MDNAQIGEIRKDFPVTEHSAYLNHAACTPLPQPGLDALTSYWAEQSTQGTMSEPKYFAVIEAAREKMACMIGADPTEIGWVQNTATAISVVAQGIRWERGDNVVLVQGDFPANVYPWIWLSEQGVEARRVAPRNHRVLLDDIAECIDARTRLVSVSFVQFNTGFRMDLDALGQLCEERGILLNVDGIQGLGALELDVHAAGVHFLGAGVHKWLMGPQGLGVLYIRKDALDQLNYPMTANWLSVENPFDFMNYEQPLAGKASRVEGSTWNLSAVVAFDRILQDVHLKHDSKQKEKRILHLTDRLIEGLLSREYDVVTPLDPRERSGVVCFRPIGDPLETLARAEAEKVIVSVRMGVVRVSPHFYNTDEEIDRLLALL